MTLQKIEGYLKRTTKLKGLSKLPGKLKEGLEIPIHSSSHLSLFLIHFIKTSHSIYL